MGQNAITFTLPPGRLVGGSLYKPNTKDAEGNPLVVKNGTNKGQPREDWFVMYAIPKEPGKAHWAHTEWGGKIWTIGATAFPIHSQRPDFAWKVIDGDSAIPNKNGRIPNQQPGYAGHWVLKISSGFKSPLVVAQNGQWVQQPQENFAQAGDYVQAQVVVDDNGSQQQAGIYINHRLFAFSGHGERISTGGIDPNAAGFSMALPAGASAAPMGSGMPLPMAPGAMPTPPVPGMPAMPAMPAAAAAPVAPPPVPAAPAVPQLVQVPGAAYTIEQCRAGGWTDDQIVAAGHATRAVPAPAPMPPAMPAAPGVAPLPPGISAQAPGAPVAPIAPAAPVIPNPSFPQIPPAPGAGIPMPPAAPAAPQLTPAGAALGTYESFRSQGWSDEQMRAQGYLA